MRWPFGPPHLKTLPKKETKRHKKKTKKTNKKKPKKETKTKKTQKYQKKSFSVISQNFLFFGGVQKLPFLTTWPRKRAPPKHYKNRGFSTPIFEKQLCVTKRPFLDKKNQIHKFQLSFFFLPFSSLSTTKNTKICWNPYFYSVLANLKREFSKN